MKSRPCGLVFLFLLLAGAPVGAQVPTLINYQGRLMSETNLYNGPASVVFRIHDSPTGPGIVWYQDSNNVTIVDGLYTAVIGDDTTGPGDMSWTRAAGNFYIEMEVNGTILSPRERVLAVAYAITAGGVTNGAITTMMIADGAVMGYHLNDNAVDSSKIQDGSILFGDINQNTAAYGQVIKWNGSAWVAADESGGAGGETLYGYEEYGFFSPAPNAGGTDVIAMGVGCSAGGSCSIVGGGAYNTALGADYAVVDGGAYNTNSGSAAVIGGGLYNRIAYGGSNSVVAGGVSNVIEGYTAAIGGGQGNTIQDRAAYSVIGGGQHNLVGTGSYACAIASGAGNQIQPGVYQGFIGAGGANRIEDGDYGFIGAGQLNRILGDSSWSVIGGGRRNTIDNDADYAVIGGGYSNTCTAAYAVVPGGFSNTASGVASFAAGQNAEARHAGSFVWNGATGETFRSTAAGQFLVNAPGGVGLNVIDPQADLHLVGRTNGGLLSVCPDALGTAGAELRLCESRTGDWGVSLIYNWHSNTFEIFGMTPTKTTGPHVVVTRDEGRVGIGTQNLDTNYLLSVGGAIRCEEIVVETGWADFVFDPDYRLLSLEEVEQHIVEQGRLPDLPSAADVSEHGVGLGGMQVMLLQKIEELTLHTIRQQKEIQSLRQEVAEIRRESGRE